MIFDINEILQILSGQIISSDGVRILSNINMPKSTITYKEVLADVMTLPPCPFCGGRAEVITSSEHQASSLMYIRCCGCHCRTKSEPVGGTDDLWHGFSMLVYRRIRSRWCDRITDESERTATMEMKLNEVPKSTKTLP